MPYLVRRALNAAFTNSRPQSVRKILIFLPDWFSTTIFIVLKAPRVSFFVFRSEKSSYLIVVSKRVYRYLMPLYAVFSIEPHRSEVM